MNWQPAERYFVMTPSIRMAEAILDVEHEINPRLPMIRITSSVDSFYGRRGIPLLTLDPHAELRARDREKLRIFSQQSRFRDWVNEDFAYLKHVSQIG